MKAIYRIISIAAAALMVCSCCCNKEQKEMKHESETFVYESQTAWGDGGGGAERQILGYNDDVMMVKVKFEKGEGGTPHSHPHSQTTYISSGKFEFTVGDETKIVEAGDGLYMAPDVEHSCICLEDGILIDCFAPMRETFIATE